MTSFPVLAGSSIGSLAVPLVLLLWPGYQDTSAPQAISGEIQLKLELRQGNRWQPVDVHTVFRNRDEIRFTFRTSFAGYLRVANRSSDGETSSLFPLDASKQQSQFDPNVDYLIPGPKGSFVVGGKAGFDLTEWVVSSLPLEGNWQPMAFSNDANTLLPRCQDGELQGRRPCLDDRAGPAPVAASKDRQSPPDTPLIARDLSFRSKGLSAQISVPDISKTLVVYEFRIAHR